MQVEQLQQEAVDAASLQGRLQAAEQEAGTLRVRLQEAQRAAEQVPSMCQK
jgi:hypothetical protein